MSRKYGVIALFDTAADIYHAAEQVRDAGYQRWDALTPFPVHGLDAAMGLRRSKVPIFTFVGGFVGFWTGMFIAWYMGAYDYPLVVGGMPYFSPVFPFPVAYELTILLAAFGAFFGQFITNRLPMHHHPVMNYEKFASITDDRFAIVIESQDPIYDESETEALLRELGGKEVTFIDE